VHPPVETATSVVTLVNLPVETATSVVTLVNLPVETATSAVTLVNPPVKTATETLAESAEKPEKTDPMARTIKAGPKTVGDLPRFKTDSC
jgi:hypothetical protein